MTVGRRLTLLSLGCTHGDDDLRLMNLCMSVCVLGVDMRLATQPAQVLHPPRRPTAQVLVVAGLDAPQYDAIALIGALAARCLGLIAITEGPQQYARALAAGVDRVLPISIDRESFVADVRSLLDVYAPSASHTRCAGLHDADD